MVSNIFFYPEPWGRWIQFDLRIFFKWVAEKPPTSYSWLEFMVHIRENTSPVESVWVLWMVNLARSELSSFQGENSSPCEQWLKTPQHDETWPQMFSGRKLQTVGILKKTLSFCGDLKRILHQLRNLTNLESHQMARPCKNGTRKDITWHTFWKSYLFEAMLNLMVAPRTLCEPLVV